MNLLLRVLYIILSSFRRGKLTSVLDTSRIKLWVLPNDLDFNWHMNNGRYLTIMDLGRLDLILRSGLVKIMWEQKNVPILASAKIRYRMPLNPLKSYYLETKILGWDEKWFYIEQRFLLPHQDQKEDVAAIGLVKGCFYDTKSGQTVPSQQILSAIGETMTSPPLPNHILDWQKAEDTLKEVTRHA